jgi:hypothetical protein
MSDHSRENRSSTLTLNSLAARMARCSEGSEDSLSIEMMVCLDTPNFFARSYCVRFVIARYSLTLFFNSITQLSF